MLIDIPKDVTGNKAEYEPVKIQPIVKYEECTWRIIDLVEVIKKNKAMVRHYVGGGAILSDASEELRALWRSKGTVSGM